MADDTPRDERTEEATPRRRQEAREKGQVALSTELVASLTLAVGLGGLVLGGGAVARSAGAVVRWGLGELAATGTRPLALRDAASLLERAIESVAPALALVIAPLLLVGFLAGYGQVGFQVAPKALAFDPARLNPVKGLSRLFGARALMRTLMASLKLLFVAGAMVGAASFDLPRLGALVGGDLGPVLAAGGAVLFRATVSALLAVAVLGLVDLVFQRFQHERDLRMTKKEVKEEHKNTEGDPHVRGRIRQIQRELASRRMMSDVPDATVVVTNPTHYAVALRYDRAGDGARAPQVVAKGVDEVAQRIKEVARDAGVVVFEDVQLARALHARCEIGDEVPVELYQAVASVLAYVFNLEGAAAAV